MRRDMNLIKDIILIVAESEHIDVPANDLWVLDHEHQGNRSKVDYHIWLCDNAGFICKSPDKEHLHFRLTLAGWDCFEQEGLIT